MPRCRARNPHLRNFDDECEKQMKTILLGASNSWFPITLSALSIPTTSNQLIQTVEKYWTSLGKAPNQATLETLIEVFQFH